MSGTNSLIGKGYSRMVLDIQGNHLKEEYMKVYLNKKLENTFSTFSSYTTIIVRFIVKILKRH